MIFILSLILFYFRLLGSPGSSARKVVIAVVVAALAIVVGISISAIVLSVRAIHEQKTDQKVETCYYDNGMQRKEITRKRKRKTRTEKRTHCCNSQKFKYAVQQGSQHGFLQISSRAKLPRYIFFHGFF